MTQQPGSKGGETGGAAAPPVPRLLAYARLSKLEFFDFYLSIFVVWSLLGPDQRFTWAALGTLALFLLGEFGVVSAVMAFDDVTGYLDGSDIANYEQDSSGLRKRHRKPLLDGTLSPEQAARFGRMAVATGGTLWLLTLVVGPHNPTWAIVLTVLVLVLSVQYSWGLNLSYKGGGEALIAFSPMCIVLIPYGIITGEAGGLVVTQAVLFGLWQILVSCYSNSNDIAGDTAVGRRNAATSFGVTGNQLFVSGLTALETSFILAATALGWVPWWFPLALLVVLGLRWRQLRGFLTTHEPLLARRRGINIHRVGVVTLVVFNLVHAAL